MLEAKVGLIKREKVITIVFRPWPHPSLTCKDLHTPAHLHPNSPPKALEEKLGGVQGI